MGTVPPTLAYDAERAPDARAWRAVDPGRRLAAVQAYHRALAAPHPPMTSPGVHAALHVVVEDQLAAAQPPEAPRALARLLSRGMARHEAVHALGAVAAAAAERALSGERFDALAYARALDAL